MSKVAMAKSVVVPFVIYAVAFLDMFGVSVVIPLMSRHARDIGASPTVAGMIGSLYGILQLVSSPLVGRWSDMSGRRYVLLCCLLLSAVGYALFGLSSTILMLIAARIPAGIFKHTQELLRGYMAEATPKKSHVTIFGQMNAAGSIGFIVGPPIGGHMAELPGGFYIISMLSAGLFVLNFVLVWLFLPECNMEASSTDDKPTNDRRDNGSNKDEASSTNDKRNTKNDRNADNGFHPLAFVRSFQEISWTDLWDIFLVRMCMGLAIMVYRSNFAMLLDYRYEASPKVIGYVISYSGFIGMISGFFVGRIAQFYKDDARLLLHAGIMQFATLAVITWAPSLTALMVCLTPLSLANSVARVCAVNLTIERGQGQQTGALLGIGASIMSISRMLSPALGGVAQQMHMSGPGLMGSFFAGAAVAVLAVVPQDGRTPKSDKDKTL